MIEYYVRSFMTVTGYAFWFFLILSTIFSLIFNKISDKEREKRELSREQFHEHSNRDNFTGKGHTN